MINESPYDCDKTASGSLLERTADQARTLFPVIVALTDDLANRLKFQSEAIIEVKRAVVRKIRYRLNAQKKKLQGVIDFLALVIANRLAEQELMLNQAAPGLREIINESGGLAAETPGGKQGEPIQGVANGVVPLPGMYGGGSGGPVPTKETPGNTQWQTGSGAIQTYNDGQTSVKIVQNQTVDTIKQYLPEPIVAVDPVSVTLTYRDGTQVTGNVNAKPGELQFYPAGGGQPIVLPIVIPQEVLATLPSGGQIAIMIYGDTPLVAVSAPCGGSNEPGTGSGQVGGWYQSGTGTVQSRPDEQNVGVLQGGTEANQVPTSDGGASQGVQGTVSAGTGGQGASWGGGNNGHPTTAKAGNGPAGQDERGAGKYLLAQQGPFVSGPQAGSSIPGMQCVLVYGVPCGQGSVTDQSGCGAIIGGRLPEVEDNQPIGRALDVPLDDFDQDDYE